LTADQGADYKAPHRDDGGAKRLRRAPESLYDLVWPGYWRELVGLVLIWCCFRAVLGTRGYLRVLFDKWIFERETWSAVFLRVWHYLLGFVLRHRRLLRFKDKWSSLS
jgi:hypothetical protein